MLEGEGYSVMSYADALRTLRAFETNTPDLAILDIKMPNINGVELLRRLRQKSDVPVIMTGQLEEEDEVRGLRAGADAYIRKPFSERTLIERVRAVLRRADPPSLRRATISGANENGPGVVSACRCRIGWPPVDPLACARR